MIITHCRNQTRISSEQKQTQTADRLIYSPVFGGDLQSQSQHTSLSSSPSPEAAQHLPPASSCPLSRCPLRALMTRSACGREQGALRHRGHIWGVAPNGNGGGGRCTGVRGRAPSCPDAFRASLGTFLCPLVKVMAFGLARERARDRRRRDG